MKLSRISLAMAAACGALASAPAFAITASNYSNTGEFAGDTLNIRVSGATAQDNGILGSALSLCVAGTVHRYAISNNFVFYCTPDVGTNAGQITVPTGKTKLAIYKYSVGGSAFGVGPINSNVASDGSTLTSAGNQLPFLDLTKLNTLCAGTNATITTPSFGTSLGTYTNVACANGSGSVTTLATTYIGVSDVEPAFFSSNTSNVTADTSYALIFGVPVSLNIRNALQAQQGLAVGDDSEGAMPSLTSAQVVSAFTQLGQTWAGIGVASGLPSGGDTIYVARRVDSSGTQKTFEALVASTPNGQPGLKTCAVGTDLFVAPDSANTTTGDADTVCASGTPPTVAALSGGGNVRQCLINHNTAGRGAIGMLTTEDKPGAAAWRFVKVDGITPNQAQTAAGKYRFYDESTLNTRTAGAFQTSAALGYSAVVSRLKADFANPAIVNVINGANQTFGKAGVMALLTAQSPQPAPDYTGASSIVPWTKLVGGSTLDNCQAPKAVF